MIFDKTIINSKKITFFVSYISFLGFILAAILNVSFIKESLLLLSLLFYIFSLFWFKHQYKFYDLLCIAFLIVWFNTGQLVGDRISREFHFFYSICCFMAIFASLFYIIKSVQKIKLLDFLRHNFLVFLVITLFVVFSLETINAWAMWDARVYYSFPYGNSDIQRMVETYESNLSSFYDLYIAGHASAGYSLWLLLFQMFKPGYEMVQVADIALACVSIYAYYKIVNYFMHDKSKLSIFSVILTLPYAFSPFVLGMVGNINVDSITTYLLVVFIASSLYKMECLEIITATALCFTKETAVIYYCMYILAKILLEFGQKENTGLKTFLELSVGNLKNYVYSIPVILWIILYCLNPSGGWGNGEGSGILWNNQGMHCFGFNKTIIMAKLKQVFLLNFNWVFWLFIIVAVYMRLRDKRKKACEGSLKVLPLSLTGIAVIIFGIIYITCTHARYITPLIPSLYLVSTILFLSYGKILYAFSGGISLILLLQCFLGIDPVMKVVFPSMCVGQTKIYSMYEHNIMSFSDCIVYNRQYQYWGETLQLVLQDAEYDGEMLIVLPDDQNCSRYYLFGDHESLWNKEDKRLEYYNENVAVPEHHTKINVIQIHTANGEYKGDNILYIIPAWGMVDESFILEREVYNQGTVEWKGYLAQWYVLHERIEK